MAAWEAAIRAIGADEAALRAAGLWTHGRADFLGVIGQHRDELTHSRMVGWLLDPCAQHGLGTRLLAALLRAFPGESFDHARLDQARVSWEVPVAEGRMDIVVSAPGLYLVIKNKVDSDEGNGQCRYYMEHVTAPDARAVPGWPEGQGIAYRDDDTANWRSMHSDFVVFHEVDGKIVASILDPHGHHLDDALMKLKALGKIRRSPRQRVPSYRGAGRGRRPHDGRRHEGRDRA